MNLKINTKESISFRGCINADKYLGNACDDSIPCSCSGSGRVFLRKVKSNDNGEKEYFLGGRNMGGLGCRSFGRRIGYERMGAYWVCPARFTFWA